jgi:hypothetical protein
MANEFIHKAVGAQLSQTAEYEHIEAHQFEGQEQGDVLYASSATQLSKLAHGNVGEFLQSGGHGANPSWAAISRKNVIINGAGQVYQRAAAYTLVKDTYGIACDRWYGMATGTAVSAGTFEQYPAAISGGYSKTGFYFNGVTLTGTGILYLRYRMEAKDAAYFMNNTASFSCRVYHNVGSAINYTIYIRKADAADNFSAVTAISDSGAISVAGAAQSLSYLGIAMGDCSNGVEIEIKIECGAITTKGFIITDCQFELGSVATPFEFRPYGQELVLCQRYFQKSYLPDVAPGAATSAGAQQWENGAANTATKGIMCAFTVQTRIEASVIIYDDAGASGKCTNAGGDGQTADVQNVSTRSFQIRDLSTVSTSWFRSSYTASAEL